MALARLSRRNFLERANDAVLVVLVCSLLTSLMTSTVTSATEDNEFAEFEEFDDDQFERQQQKAAAHGAESAKKAKEDVADETTTHSSDSSPSPKAFTADSEEDEDGVVEDEGDEFSHLEDEEEFVNTDSGKSSRDFDSSGKKDLKIAQIPAHLRTNWFNFQVELVMLMGLSVYLINYFWGKTKNHSLSSAWFDAHRDILEANFHLVGDDGISQEPSQGVLVKESDSLFRIWCSGRAGCQSLVVQMKLIKRQDIVSLISGIFRPVQDKIIVQVTMNSDEMDSYVFAVGNKKTVSKISKDTMDLYQYCIEKKVTEKFGLPDSFLVLSEIGEATSAFLDNKVCAILTKFLSYVDYIHVSDQYSGLKAADIDSVNRLPETSKVLIFCFNIPKSGVGSEADFSNMRPLLQMIIYCIDKVRRFKLSKEAKTKAEKNRQRVEESFLKTTHAARVEAAQARKEERIKERKDRIMNEEDPEKQKLLEKRELKREAKRKQPKVKQLKIKA